MHIDGDKIAEVCRYNDAEMEEHRDFSRFFDKRDVDFLGLTYVAEQRALRVVMAEKGMNPNRSRPALVALNVQDRERITIYTAMFLDGFAAGLGCQESEER